MGRKLCGCWCATLGETQEQNKKRKNEQLDQQTKGGNRQQRGLNDKCRAIVGFALVEGVVVKERSVGNKKQKFQSRYKKEKNKEFFKMSF